MVNHYLKLMSQSVVPRCAGAGSCVGAGAVAKPTHGSLISGDKVGIFFLSMAVCW